MTRSWISVVAFPKLIFVQSDTFYWDIQQRDKFYSGATRYYPPIRMGVRIRGLSLYNLSGTFVLRD